MLSYLLVFLTGLIIGSFLNVCIYRLPVEQSIVFPGSHCICCGRLLHFMDLVPVISFFVLQGKCRRCNSKISWRYPLVELLTGMNFMWCYFQFSWTVDFLIACSLTSFLIVITFIDLEHQLILDKVLAWLLLFSLLPLEINGNPLIWWDRLVASLLGGLLLLLIAVLSRGAMGDGDIKLMTVLGMWLGIVAAAETLFIAFVSGGIWGGILLISGRKSRQDVISFGPFLCLGAWFSYFYGPELFQWYLTCFI